MKLAIDMIRRITTESEVRGFDFCTLNLEKSVTRVLEGLGWTGNASKTPRGGNKLIIVSLALHPTPLGHSPLTHTHAPVRTLDV